MYQNVEEILNTQINSKTSIGGGCIANSQIIETVGGEKYFYKSYGKNRAIIQCEVNGLNELAKSTAIRIPKVIAVTDGWEYRIDLYKLYHVLNHLNLFGNSYYPQVISIIGKYVK